MTFICISPLYAAGALVYVHFLVSHVNQYFKIVMSVCLLTTFEPDAFLLSRSRQ
jgi:hypothetical protein